MPPVVAPEGNLGFILFIELVMFTWLSPTGVLVT
jgi:hypothetical protein